RAEFPAVKLIANKTNAGYARGNNMALAAAQGEWLLTLNPDTEQIDHVLQYSIDLLRRCPANIGCLAPRLVYPDGRTQHSIRGWPTPLGIIGDASGLGLTFPDSKFGSYRLKNFDYLTQQLAPQPMGT